MMDIKDVGFGKSKYDIWIVLMSIMLAGLCVLMGFTIKTERIKAKVVEDAALWEHTVSAKKLVPTEPETERIVIDDTEVQPVEQVEEEELLSKKNIAGVIRFSSDTVIPYYNQGSDVDEGATLYSDVMPGEVGRTLIFGHRDQSFRNLKYLDEGDVLTFETLEGTYRYKIVSIDVMQPDELPLFDPDYANITLVTCYPFRYVGAAPKRYVVQLKMI